MREITYATVTHPEFMGDFRHVDIPALANPAPVLGWEGDPRLAVYWTGTKHILYRLEADGEYRGICEIEGRLGTETINRIICRLIEIDQRRGFKPGEVADQMDTDREREADRVLTDQIHAFADKLHYGLSRSHLPGIDVTRVRNA